MANCPEKDCHQRVDDVHAEVFDKPDGLKERVNRTERKKIPWLALTWISPLFLVIVGGLAGIIYADGKENAKAITETAIRVARLEEKYNSIDKNTTEILNILKKQVNKDQDDKKVESDKEKE